jgi:hypothetical protein
MASKNRLTGFLLDHVKEAEASPIYGLYQDVEPHISRSNELFRSRTGKPGAGHSTARPATPAAGGVLSPAFAYTNGMIIGFRNVDSPEMDASPLFEVVPRSAEVERALLEDRVSLTFALAPNGDIGVHEVTSQRGVYSFSPDDFALSLKTLTSDRYWLDAVVRAIDPDKLDRELDEVLSAAESPPAGSSPPPSASSPSTGPSDLFARVLLSDILDDSILAARAGDKAYPLRVLLTHLGEGLDTDTGLGLASALNVYFRVAMDEEVKMRLGLEASRLYYRFAAERALDGGLVTQASPLLATLMSGELGRLRFESMDAARVFDSQVHERTEDADSANSQVLSPATFLCRVTATNMVRARALVRT